MPPPVMGDGEPERDANGLNAGVDARSLLPSSAGDGDLESGLDEPDDEESLSLAPSAVAADWGAAGCDAVAGLVSVVVG